MLFTYKAKIKSIEGTFTDAIAFLISEWMDADSYTRSVIHITFSKNF